MRFGKGKASKASAGKECDNEHNTPIYYFSYGSLVNPIARQRRGVCTNEAHAALLPNYRLSFACGGTANIAPKTGWEVYGVVMKCVSMKDWNLLKDSSAGYDIIEVDVYPLKEAISSTGESGSAAEEEEGFARIQDTPIRARAFIVPQDDEKDSVSDDRVPQERYLRVTASGMKAYGVDEDYINDEIMGTAYIPSRGPEDYLRFPPSDPDQAELASLSLPAWNKECHRRLAKAGKACDKTLILFRVGDHAVQVIGDDASPDNPFCVWLRDRLQGPQDSTWVIVQTLFDPDLPLIASPEEVTCIHQAWAENQLMEKFEQAGVKATAIFQVELNGARRGDKLKAAVAAVHNSINNLRSSEHSSMTPSLRSSAGESQIKSKQWSPSLQGRVRLIRAHLPSLRSSAGSGSVKSQNIEGSIGGCHVQHGTTSVSVTSMDVSVDKDTSMVAIRDPPKRTLKTLFSNSIPEASSDHFCAAGDTNSLPRCNHFDGDHHPEVPPIASLTFFTT